MASRKPIHLTTKDFATERYRAARAEVPTACGTYIRLTRKKPSAAEVQKRGLCPACLEVLNQSIPERLIEVLGPRGHEFKLVTEEQALPPTTP